MSGAHMRRFPRINKSVKVTVRYPDPKDGKQQQEEFESKDISRSGVRVFSNNELEMESFVMATFHIPDGSPPIELFAKVVRQEANNDGTWDVGLHFTSFTKEAMERLNNYLIDEMKQGGEE